MKHLLILSLYASALFAQGGVNIINVGNRPENPSVSFTAQTSATITHNLNTLNIIVECRNSSGATIANTISSQTVNAVTVTFSSSTGKCVVNGTGGVGPAGPTGPTGPAGSGGSGIGSVSGIVKGDGAGNPSAAVAGTDYQAPINLTTTGTSGAATFSGGTLNIPQYSGGSGAVASVFGRTGAVSAAEADYQSFYPRLSQAYANPAWLSSLDWSKITGVTGTPDGTKFLRDDGSWAASVTSIDGLTGPLVFLAPGTNNALAFPAWQTGTLRLQFPLASQNGSATGGLLSGTEYTALAAKAKTGPACAAGQHISQITSSADPVCTPDTGTGGATTITSPDGFVDPTTVGSTVELRAGPTAVSATADNNLSGNNSIGYGNAGADSTLANEGTTGTVVSLLAKIHTGALARRMDASDTARPLGVTISGAGITGFSRIRTSGIVGCLADNTVAVLDWIVVGTATDGRCRSNGASEPSSGWVVGRALSAASAGASFQMLLDVREKAASSSSLLEWTLPLGAFTPGGGLAPFSGWHYLAAGTPAGTNPPAFEGYGEHPLMRFAATGTTTIYTTFRMPTTRTPTSMSVTLNWIGASTAGQVARFQAATMCWAAGVSVPYYAASPYPNTANLDSTVVGASTSISQTATGSVSLSGCAAGDNIGFRFQRLGDDGVDNAPEAKGFHISFVL